MNTNSEKKFSYQFFFIKLCKSKSGNDSYADRCINTFNDLPKIKSTQTEKLVINEKNVWCTAWDMYDSYNTEESNQPNGVTREKSNNKLSKESSNFNKTDTVMSKFKFGIYLITKKKLSSYKGSIEKCKNNVT